MEYNSERKKTIIPEYGRYVQEMIEFTKTIENREKRNSTAKTIIRQMSFLQQSNIKDSNELDRKLWDHLHIISNFELDVDSPYPKPDPDLYSLPIKPKYNSESKELSYRYYGKIIEDMIQEAVLMEEGEEKKAFIRDIANNMKKLYIAWNKGNVIDDLIFKHLNEISGGRLSVCNDTELSSNFSLPNSQQNYKNKKKKKDFKPNYPNGPKKFFKKKQ